jgi:hypothetical protein
MAHGDGHAPVQTLSEHEQMGIVVHDIRRVDGRKLVLISGPSQAVRPLPERWVADCRVDEYCMIIAQDAVCCCARIVHHRHGAALLKLAVVQARVSIGSSSHMPYLR